MSHVFLEPLEPIPETGTPPFWARQVSLRLSGGSLPCSFRSVQADRFHWSQLDPSYFCPPFLRVPMSILEPFPSHRLSHGLRAKGLRTGCLALRAPASKARPAPTPIPRRSFQAPLARSPSFAVTRRKVPQQLVPFLPTFLGGRGPPLT